MSTLASTRPPPLKLTIPSLEEAGDHAQERRAGGGGQEVGKMHPDCLPLPLVQPGNSPQVREEEEDEQTECEEQLNIEDEEAEEEHDLDLEDPASCCSENSVLSVGQEQSEAAQAALSAQAQARQRLLISQIYRPSAFSSTATTVLPPSEGPPFSPPKISCNCPPPLERFRRSSCGSPSCTPRS
ncbi:GD15080 [Drosophila simulans]|uniref:GD15080 n=1 Tax=Drosophila simulans TaxID=7240 RepID=B4NVW7_DROSI|nr:GD15080 [Drosophila simulans]